VLQEAERLRAENAELKIRIAKFQGSLAVEFDPSISGPGTGISITIEETRRSRTKRYTVSTTFKDIFLRTYDEILTEPAEPYMQSVIGRAFARGQTAIGTSYSCDHDSTITIRRQLDALGLIETKAKGGSGGLLAWIVTDKGRRYSASHSALKAIPEQ